MSNGSIGIADVCYKFRKEVREFVRQTLFKWLV